MPVCGSISIAALGVTLIGSLKLTGPYPSDTLNIGINNTLGR